jgi:hypothetical protein
MIFIPQPDWLPPTIPRSGFNGTDSEYVDSLYEVFKTDFIHSLHRFEGKPLYLKRHPFTNGKEEDFWHILFGKGATNTQKIDPLRCERLPWVLPIIKRAGDGLTGVRRWKNIVNGDSRICLMTEYPHSHMVVIAERSNKNILFTAHPVANRQFDKNVETYEKYLKTEAAS